MWMNTSKLYGADSKEMKNLSYVLIYKAMDVVTKGATFSHQN